jgi:hypothetical protein
MEAQKKCNAIKQIAQEITNGFTSTFELGFPPL